MRACLGFLRDLEGHAVRQLRGEGLPAHASSCSSCRERLAAAVGQARLLSRLQPELPAELGEPAFFEQIHDRVLAARAAGVQEVLARGLRPVQAPAVLGWPLSDLPQGQDGHPARAVAEPPPVPAATLWARVRGAAAAHVAARRTARRRQRLALAAMVAGLLVGGWFVANRGTSRPPEIVFERLAEMPPVDLSPVAVLRRALGD